MLRENWDIESLILDLRIFFVYGRKARRNQIYTSSFQEKRIQYWWIYVPVPIVYGLCCKYYNISTNCE